jgi:hypothetical protein
MVESEAFTWQEEVELKRAKLPATIIEKKMTKEITQ